MPDTGNAKDCYPQIFRFLHLKAWFDEHIWLVSQDIDCLQSPIFPWDRRDIARVTVNGDILIFMTLIQDGNPQRIPLDLDDLMGK